MILALLNGRAGVGKTTLALQLAAEWAARHERVVLIDADPRQDALRWRETRARAGLAAPFRVLPAVPERFDRRMLARLASRSDRIIIDGPSGAAALSLPALLASDLAVIPTGPSPKEAGAALEMVGLAMDARLRRPGLPVRFVFNRRDAGSDGERETAAIRDEYEPALFESMVGRHSVLGAIPRSGRLVREIDADAEAAREITALASEIDMIQRAGAPSRAFAERILRRVLKPWIATRQFGARLLQPLERPSSNGAARAVGGPLEAEDGARS